MCSESSVHCIALNFLSNFFAFSSPDMGLQAVELFHISGNTLLVRTLEIGCGSPGQ